LKYPSDCQKCQKKTTVLISHSRNEGIIENKTVLLTNKRHNLLNIRMFKNIYY